MSQPTLRVFIDESGQRSPSIASSDYFIMSAVVFMDNAEAIARQNLLDLKKATNRRPEHLLHFSKLKPEHRTQVANLLGGFSYLGYISVVACKRVLADKATWVINSGTPQEAKVPMYGPLTEDEAYLKSYQYVLERVSWVAAANNARTDITLEHTVRFKQSALKDFEAAIRGDDRCQVKWDYVPKGARMTSKRNEDLLQLSDVVASATAAAFNGHPKTGTTTEYIGAMKPRIWRGPKGVKPTSYGLKMHPWDDTVKALHPWLLSF